MDNMTLRGKLKSAFVDIRKKGIIALMNFRCCQNCGCTEIAEMMKDRPDTKGYVFFHKQDNDRLVRTGMLYLAFGGRGNDDNEETGDADTVGVGNEVVAVLREHGLKVEWNGDGGTRILVESGGTPRILVEGVV